MAGCLSFHRTVLAAALAAGMSAASAEELRDPTRPPGASESATTADGSATISSGLQSIVRRRGAKPQALINGELVPLGGKVGDARLIRIDEDSVVLQTPSGRETLTLTPGIQKAAGKPPAAKQRSPQKAP